MRTIFRQTAIVATFIFAMFAANSAQNILIPNPVLLFMGQEPVTIRGTNFVRYNYNVFNFADIPNGIFEPAPTLPPCGRNANSSRTWVDLFDQNGKRLYGFCTLGKNSDLNSIWFSLEEGVIPPSYIYIEIYDRATNIKYKSNLADTTM